MAAALSPVVRFKDSNGRSLQVKLSKASTQRIATVCTEFAAGVARRLEEKRYAGDPVAVAKEATDALEFAERLVEAVEAEHAAVVAALIALNGGDHDGQYAAHPLVHLAVEAARTAKELAAIDADAADADLTQPIADLTAVQQRFFASSSEAGQRRGTTERHRGGVPVTAFPTLATLPQTPAEVALHELAHGFAAILACAEHHPGLLEHLTISLSVTRDDEGECHEEWGVEVKSDIRARVSGLAAVGPIALLPTNRLKAALLHDHLGTVGVLSEPDVEQLRRGDLMQSETRSAILATFYHMRQLGADRLTKLCNVVLAAPKRSIDVPALILVPRQQAKAAIAAVPGLVKAVADETSLMEALR